MYFDDSTIHNNHHLKLHMHLLTAYIIICSGQFCFLPKILKGDGDMLITTAFDCPHFPKQFFVNLQTLHYSSKLSSEFSL